MLKVIDLFSGIGGFALGLESTGYFKTIQFVENEKWCQKILTKNFPGVPIHDDVKTFQGYGADVVVGGFPCQPFSVAGKQKATKDNRHLWPDMFRVIKETKPTWVIGENVRNIVSISDGMVLEQVYLDLESEGYEVQSFIIPASAVNAPHQRYRTWIVAHTDHGNHNEKKEIRTRWNTINSSSADVADTDSRLRRGGRTIRPSGENGQRGFHTTQEEQTPHDLRSKTIRRNTVRGETENVAHSDSWQSRSRNESEPRKKKQFELSSNSTSERGVLAHTDQRFNTESQWNSEPNVGRVVNGLPNRVDRLRGLGNAIVPQIAYQIGKAIMEAEDGESEMSSAM